MRSDIELNRSLCLHCRELNSAKLTRCSRCDSVLHQRVEHSIAKTLSYMVASLMFLVPANLLPIMIVYELGKAKPSTIIGGFVHFMQNGSYAVAIIIFVASVLVPLLKICVVAYLLIIVKLNKTESALRGLRLYRIVRFVGKWSMLDVFVVAFMVSMVQFEIISSIVAGPAALAFLLAVVSMMLATRSFDPRLMFDKTT